MVMQSRRREDVAIVAVVSIFCLHLLRNLVPIYPAIVCGIALLSLVFTNRAPKWDRVGMVVLALLVAALSYAVAISYVKFPEESYFGAIGRLGFMAPFALFAALVLNTPERLKLAVQTLVVWVAICASSIFYQTIFGPVDWFPLASGRAGSVRYATLAGNLTAMGVAGGLALPLTFFAFRQSIVLRGALLGIILVGMFMSLQKAAVANIALFALLMLAYALHGILRKKPGFAHDAKMAGVAVLVGAAILVPLSFIPPNPGSGANANVDSMGDRTAFAAMTNPAGAGYIDDIGFVQSVIDRTITLPKMLFDQYGMSNMLTGVGLVGGSGTMGFVDIVCADMSTLTDCRIRYPMAHNSAVEFMAMGGLPLLFAVLLAFGLVAWRAARAYFSNDDADTFAAPALMVMFLVVVNAPMTSGILSQPYIAAAIFLVIVPVLLYRAERWLWA